MALDHEFYNPNLRGEVGTIGDRANAAAELISDAAAERINELLAKLISRSFEPDASEVEGRYVCFISGDDKGRTAKVCGLNLGDGVTINVVIFLDGSNGWNHVHSHVEKGDRVVVVNDLVELNIVHGTVAAQLRPLDHS